MKSFLDILGSVLHHHAHEQREMPEPFDAYPHHQRDSSPYMLLESPQSDQQSASSQIHAQRKAKASEKTEKGPTREEVFNQLGRLADDYHLPKKIVYATAAAESDFDVDKVDNNYAHDKRNRPVKDRHGKPVIRSHDFGLMQINSSRINHDSVTNPAGRKLQITDGVRKNWKVNAEVGVATLKHDYDLVKLSTPSGASPEDIALATYAAYNHGPRHWHNFLEKDNQGLPKDGGVRNFYNRYEIAPNR